MTIDEAIKTLDNDLKEGLRKSPLDSYYAVRLGIEALKVFQHRRKTYGVIDSELLPGETKD